MERKADIFNLTSLLLDTDSKLVAEIKWRNYRIFLELKDNNLSYRHRKMFKVQRKLENEFYCKDITISFWTKNKVQERIAEYKIRSNDLAIILSSIRLHSIMANWKKNEVRKKTFQDIEKSKKNIEVKEIY